MSWRDLDGARVVLECRLRYSGGVWSAGRGAAARFGVPAALF